jgi:hypothetical protein
MYDPGLCVWSYPVRRPTRRVPIVVARSSYKPWLVILRLDDVPRFVEEMNRADSQVRPALEGKAAEPQGLPRQPMADHA